MKYSVKHYGLLLFFCISSFVVKAQQKHFIYVQSEDRQPFAVVLKGKVYSSSDYGYVIIPKLEDGDYSFTVSFPMNKFPDQSFAFSINKKDAGYFLKNSTNGWALESMQTQKLIMSGAVKATQQNAFGDMLADVVSDSTLTKTATPQVTAEGGTGVGNGKTTVAEGGTGVGNGKTTVGDATTATAAAVATAGLTANNIIDEQEKQLEKIGEIKADTGINMLFVDKSQNSADTINVFIPAETASTVTEVANQNTVANTVTQDSLATASFQVNNTAAATENANAPYVTATNNQPAETVTDKSATDVSNPFYKPETVTTGAAATVVASTVTQPGNQVSGNNDASAYTPVNNAKPNCENPISDDDLNKLKRKMFSQNNDDAMVQYAVKYVSKKCVSTEQVKVLGSLFSSDDGRYSLYDALYKYVYDYNNYPGLESQILDPYYKKRFAALLR